MITRVWWYGQYGTVSFDIFKLSLTWQRVSRDAMVLHRNYSGNCRVFGTLTVQ